MIHRGEKNTRKVGIWSRILHMVTFAKTTDIPQWLKDRKRSDVISKANAASKMLKFASEVKMTQQKLREVYQIEKEYEIAKIKAQEEYPHVTKVMMKVISEARSIKMEKMKETLTKSQFDIYSKLFRKSKQYY